jgi:hypothetical protein
MRGASAPLRHSIIYRPPDLTKEHMFYYNGFTYETALRPAAPFPLAV